jgi:Icc-related predicted phosphoesterase
MKITFISDTHTRHHEITQDLPGGDLLVHSGDLMNSGRNIEDIKSFCKWFDSLDQYTHKVFIAGNHDRLFQNDYHGAMEIVNSYKNIIYLQDDWVEVGTDKEMVKIYGTPWQPWFYDWAFNLPRNGMGLAAKWEAIPEDTDILLTHGPAWGVLDTVAGRWHDKLGCELLIERIEKIQPKIHSCGHIHTGYGYEFKDGTHFFNAAVLDEQYEYTQKPQTIDWNVNTNEIVFIDNEN